MNLKLRVTPSNITIFFLRIIFILLLANLFGLYLKHGLGYESALGYIKMFGFDTEFNFPSFYSSMAILFSAFFLFYISIVEETDKDKVFFWKGLSFVFFFLAIDELISLHERFSILTSIHLKDLTTATGNKMWFLPYGIIVILIAAFFVKPFFKLPKKTKISFVVAGMVFIMGSIFVELISGRVLVLDSQARISHALLYTLEEVLEMLAIVLFIRALVEYVAEYPLKANFSIDTLFQKRNLTYAPGGNREYKSLSVVTFENGSSNFPHRDSIRLKR